MTRLVRFLVSSAKEPWNSFSRQQTSCFSYSVWRKTQFDNDINTAEYVSL